MTAVRSAMATIGGGGRGGGGGGEGGGGGAGKDGSKAGADGAGQGREKRKGQQQSLNHLLSFTLPPRTRPPAYNRRSKRSTGRVPFNKERYVNAQYRFLVKPTGDYTAYFADPDIFFHWPDVLQVIVSTSPALSSASTSGLDQAKGEDSLTACPICLSEPTAPRMTKCGHVFCYPCILRYLALAEDNAKWRRCPICWDAVYARDLKSVKWWDSVAAAETAHRKEKSMEDAMGCSTGGEGGSDCGDADSHRRGSDPGSPVDGPSSEVLRFCLIQRPQITTLALPRSPIWPSDLVPPHAAPWHFLPDVFRFAKFMLATPAYLISELQQDLRELAMEDETLRKLAGPNEPSLAFLDEAKRKVGEQIEKVRRELETPAVVLSLETAQRELREAEERIADGRRSMPVSGRRRGGRRNRDKREARLQAERILATEPGAQATVGSEGSGKEGDGEEDAEEAPEAFLALRSQGPSAFGSFANTPTRVTSPVDGASETHLPTDTPLSTSAGTGVSRSLGSDPGDGGRLPRQKRNVNPPPPSDASYYFYQSDSGQNIFLHPLDIRILLSHFGSYSSFPTSISVHVEGIDEGTMNEELRRRCKYLSHLPTGCDLVFVETDLSPVVGEEGLRPYAQALKQRKDRRRNKARREDRAKDKAEEKEKGALGFHVKPPPPQGLDSYPDLGRADVIATTPEDWSWSSAATATGSSPTNSSSSAMDNHPSLPSTGGSGGGAKDDGSARGVDIPVPRSALPGPRTVWGTPAPRTFASALHNSSRPVRTEERAYPPGLDPEDWETFDERWMELEEDFTLRGADGAGDGGGSAGRGWNRGSGKNGSGSGSASASAASGNPNPAGGGGKKKNKKKKTLVLTQGGRGR